MSEIEQVGREEWVIEAVGDEWVRLAAREGDGQTFSVPRSLLPDDVGEGDCFGVVAFLDRTGRTGMPAAFSDALERLTGRKPESA